MKKSPPTSTASLDFVKLKSLPDGGSSCNFWQAPNKDSRKARFCGHKGQGFASSKHLDGRITTIPLHQNEDLPKGLLRKIIREDLKMDIDSFVGLIK